MGSSALDIPSFPKLDDGQHRVFLALCASLAEGELVSRMLPKYGLNWRSLYVMVESSTETREWYARARLFQAHQVAEQAINIADGTDELGKLYDDIADLAAENIDPQHRQSWLNAFANGRVQRDKIRTDARKWYAAKLAPRLYGEKLDITSNGDSIRPGVVMLPAPEPPLTPPDALTVEQTTRVTISGKANETASAMTKLMEDFRQGRLVAAVTPPSLEVGRVDEDARFYGDDAEREK